MEKHLLIRIASFAFLEQNTFTKKNLIDSICPGQTEEQLEKKILNKYFENALNADSGHHPDLETPFFVFQRDHNLSDKTLYSIKRDVIFSYIDYLEFQEARKASMQAQKWATRAIEVSIIAIIIQIITSFFPIELNKSQFVEIKDMMSAEINK